MMCVRQVRVVFAAAVAVAVIPVSALLAGPAAATTYDVTSTANSGANTLRQALADAASHAGDDIIDIQAGLGTITLTSELLWDGSGAVTINGHGATVSGPGVGRGFVDDGANGLTINDLTVTGFGAAFSDNTAPVVSIGGPITLNNCAITGNSMQTDSEDVAGGVLSEGGQVTITDCTITGNSATTSDGDAGGAVLSEGGAVILATSTTNGNTATSSTGDAGGGILVEGGGGMTVRNSTINCNAATTTNEGGDAAGAILSQGADITINGSTVVGNSATAIGNADNSLLAPGNDINGTGNTISDDTSSCEAPPTTTTTTTAPPTPTPAPAPVVAPARFTG
jgi:hypothetical protein